MPNGFFKQHLHIEDGKSEHNHLILNMRISLGTKFQLKLTRIIWIKFVQKERFQFKTEKVNTIIQFCIFKLV